MLIRQLLARPAELAHRDTAGAAALQQDVGALLLDLGDGGELPVAGARRQRRRGEALLRIARRAVGERSAPAMAAVIGDEPLAEGLVDDLLQMRIEGGAHREPALVEAVLAVALHEIAPHL